MHQSDHPMRDRDGDTSGNQGSATGFEYQVDRTAQVDAGIAVVRPDGHRQGAVEVNQGVKALPDWVSFAVLLPVAAAALVWMGRIDVRVVGNDRGETELWVGAAHLPISVISRSAEVPRSAKSAALGRQLDPAAYVVHRPGGAAVG